MNLTEARTGNGITQASFSAAMYRTILDHAASAVLLTDTGGAVIFANSAACLLWGYTAEELIQLNCQSLLDLSDILDLNNLQYTGAEKQVSLDIPGRRKDGTKFYCTCTASYFKQDTDTVRCVITITDTTAFKDREDKLLASNERYEYAARASFDAIWDWDIHSDVLFWSDSYYELFGGDPAGQNNIASWHERIHKEDRVRVVDNMHNAIRKGLVNWMQEYRYRRADGSYAYVIDRGIIINNGTGIPGRMIGVMQDVSDLREAERGLAREQTLLQTLIDNIPDYIYVKDAKLNNVMNNRAVRRLLEKTQLAHPGALSDLLDDEAKQVHVQDDRILLENGESIINRQEALVMADGKKHWLLTSKIPLRDERGYITGLIGISRDITDRVKKINESELFLHITDIINAHDDLSVALRGIAKELVAYTGAAIAEAWITSVDKRELLLKAQSHAYEPQTGGFAADYTGKLPEGEDLPGTAWESKRIEWRTDLATCRNFNRKEAAEKAALYTAVAVPVISNDEVIAVFTCYSHDRTKASLEEHASLFRLLQQQLGTYLRSKRTEDELNRFFSLSPDLLCIAGTDGYFKKINHAFTKLLGFTEAELMANPYYYLIHPDDLNKTADSVRELAGGQDVHYFENRYRTKDGRYKWFAWTSTPISEEHILFGVGKDITDKKRLQDMEALEKEILELNAAPESTLEDTVSYYISKIEALHEGMTGSVLYVEKDRLYNLASPGLPETYCQAIEGLQAGEGQGSCGTAAFRRQKVIVTDIENDPLWENYREQALPFGYKSCWSFPIIGSNQKILGTFAFYYKEHKAPTHAEEHTIERARNLLPVIMENKLAEEALQLSNERYNLVGRATNDAIWDWDLQTNEVVRTGNGFLKLFGYTTAQVQSDYNFWTKRIHPDDLQRVTDKQREVLNNSAGHYWEDEYRFLRSDNTYAYVTDRGYILRNEQGKPTRMIGATQDSTQRKQTELLLKDLNERLEKRARDLSVSNAELERFAYVASHDLQEPLRMISGFMQLLEKKYAPSLDAKALEYIGFATDGAERMKQLILDLLEYSRVNTDTGNVTEVDMNTVLQQVTSIFTAAIQETGAVVEAGHLPVIKARRTQMLQMLQNLVGNALKYRSEAPPVIRVNGYETADRWVFSVQDNGMGIEPKFFEKIFIIFQRLHNRSEYSGTGIGLAICKKIAERHGGDIWLESQPGEGSCFYFSIAKTYPSGT